jgi:hypothetical protein
VDTTLGAALAAAEWVVQEQLSQRHTTKLEEQEDQEFLTQLQVLM